MVLFFKIIVVWKRGALLSKVPTRTGTPGKVGRHFPVREKSGHFEHTGKVREKSEKITQNTGKLNEFHTNVIYQFLVIFK